MGANRFKGVSDSYKRSFSITDFSSVADYLSSRSKNSNCTIVGHDFLRLLVPVKKLSDTEFFRFFV